MRKTVSVILVITLILGMIPVFGNAVTETTPDGTTYCPHCEQNVEFVDWDGTAPTETCHVRLPEGGLQITSGNKGLASGVTMVLDLNGQTMERTGSSSSKFFLVNSGAKLVIMDSSAEKTGTMIGKQTSSNHAGIAQIYGGDLDIYGGIFKMSEGSEAQNGGLFLISTKTTAPNVNIYGGTFYGTKATAGGVLQFSGNELNISGGTFYAGNAPTGDTLYISSGKAAITDAVIQGGVQVSSSASLAVSGKTVIEKAAENGSAYSLKLTAGKTISVGALEAPARIALTLAGDGVFTSEFETEAAAEAAKAFFAVDDATKEITVEGKTLKLAAIATEPEVTEPTTEPSIPEGAELCQHCGEYVVFDTSWTGSTAPAAGHYKLTGTTTVSSTKTLSAGDVVIDLNGKTLNRTGNKMFLVKKGGKLVFMDSSAEQTGTVISKQSAAYHAGIAQLQGGSLDIYGGTFKMHDGAAANSGGLFYGYDSSPSIRIFGGTFYGITAVRGGILYMTSGELVIQGGTFYPGKATTAGDGIYVNGSGVDVTVSGEPVIYGGMYIYSAESVNISGKPVIEKAADSLSNYSLMLNSTMAITAGVLEEGAKVTITGSGTVVTGYATTAEAIAASKFFLADDATKYVAVKGIDLVLAEKSTATTFDCPHCDDENIVWTAWDGTAALETGHYYLTDNTAVASNITLTDKGTVVLNLNGYVLSKAAAGRMFLVQGATELVIMDSSTDQTGTVVSNGINNHGMVAMAYNAPTATVSIYGGNYIAGGTTAAKNGALFSASSTGVLNIYGGEFYGAEAAKGGAVAATSGSTLNIQGGTFYPGTATLGSTVFASQTDENPDTKVTIGGTAKILGGVHIDKIASFTLEGTPVIQRDPHGTVDYSLRTATPITFGALTKGAKIAINRFDPETAVFSTAFADAAAADAVLPYIYSDDPALAIVLNENALTFAEREEGIEDLKDPSNDGILNILMIGNSFCYYYVQELYGLLTENLPEGVEEVQIYNMYYSGRNLATHLARWEANVGDCEVFRMNKDGRKNLAPVEKWSLEMALEQENWDYISLQGTTSTISYIDETKWENNKQLVAPVLTTMFGRLYELYPNAQLLYHRTWAFEVGRISGSTVYDAERNTKYDAGIQYLCDWVGNEFDQDKPYDLKVVYSGSAWKEARALNESLNLLPVGGLCARTNVANASTYQYVKDNPDAKNVGDAYHDGDIGGGQLLNAYMWYMTITGDGDLSDNNYAPSASGMPGEPNPYTLSDAHLAMLKQAAMTAYAANTPRDPEPETLRGDVNGDGTVSDQDAMYLLRYTLFGETRYPLAQSGDVNGDGAVSDQDAMYLLRFTLFGETRYPLH